MQAIEVEQDLARQFGLAAAPTLLAQRQLPQPIAFTRLHAPVTAGQRTQAARPDDAFALLVALAPTSAGEIRIDGTNDVLPPASPGDTFVFNLAQSPVVRFSEPYDFVRFYLPAATLDRLADDQGAPRVPNLRTTLPQVRDPVMQGLALSLLPALQAPDTGSTRFLDSVALAFHAHVMRGYGGTPGSGRATSPGLAPWQIRRVRAVVDASPEADPSVAALAAACRLSQSHFARGFTASMGMPPHKWLVNRRIERAKALLLGGREELSQIALACGFGDQGHFTRVFGRSEGESPGRWRRRHCN
jgi:AraC-like DNA-binding protein